MDSWQRGCLSKVYSLHQKGCEGKSCSNPTALYIKVVFNLSLLRLLIYSWPRSPKQEQAKASPTMTGNKRRSNNIASPAGLVLVADKQPGPGRKSLKRLRDDNDKAQGLNQLSRKARKVRLSTPSTPQDNHPASLQSVEDQSPLVTSLENSRIDLSPPGSSNSALFKSLNAAHGPLKTCEVALRAISEPRHPVQHQVMTQFCQANQNRGCGITHEGKRRGDQAE